MYFSETGNKFSFDDIVMALNSYMFDKYDESHYTAKIHQFYDSVGVETERKSPVFSIEDNNLVIKKSGGIQANDVKRTCSQNGGKRRRNTTVKFETLKERCRLYRDFAEGNEWYYYPELFLIATNMVNMEKGKSEFLKILDSPENEHCTSYHERNWKPILNTIIDMNYKPMSCNKCPHVKDCPHYKNMICTID